MMASCKQKKNSFNNQSEQQQQEKKMNSIRLEARKKIKKKVNGKTK